MRRWDIIMIVCLIFVAVVTPFEVRGGDSADRLRRRPTAEKRQTQMH